MQTEFALKPTAVVIDEQTILLCPAELCWLGDIAVPTSKPNQIRAVIPNLVEEWIASDIDSLFIATGARGIDGRVPVIALEKSLLQRWLDQERGSEPVAAYVDAQLLPWSPDSISVIIDGARTLLRWGDHLSGAIDTENLEIVLTQLLSASTTKACALNAWITSKTKASNVIAMPLATLFPTITATFDITVTQTTLDTDATQFLSARLSSHRPVLNLLQGEFTPTMHKDAHWQQWRPLWLAVGAAAALFVVINVIIGLRYMYQTHQAQAQNLALYRELFPQDRRIVDLRRQFQSHLNNLTEGNSSPFLTIFSVLAKEMGNGSTAVPLQLRSLVYDNTSSTLSVDIVAGRIEEIDDLSRRINTNHLTSKIQSVSNDGSQVLAHLSLKGS